jgi:hypothetical protein
MCRFRVLHYLSTYFHGYCYLIMRFDTGIRGGRIHIVNRDLELNFLGYKKDLEREVL